MHFLVIGLVIHLWFTNAYKLDIIDAPPEVEPETEPFHPTTPKNSHKETTTASASASASGMAIFRMKESF